MNDATPSTCPVCRRPSEILLLNLALGRLEREFIKRLNPLWHDHEGICARCVDAFALNARRIHEKQAHAPRAGDFRSVERFHLNAREHCRWYQSESQTATVRRRILDGVIRSAASDGATSWALFDCDETMVGYGQITHRH